MKEINGAAIEHCFRSTLFIKMAPEWNAIGTTLVQGNQLTFLLVLQIQSSRTLCII